MEKIAIPISGTSQKTLYSADQPKIISPMGTKIAMIAISGILYIKTSDLSISDNREVLVRM